MKLEQLYAHTQQFADLAREDDLLRMSGVLQQLATKLAILSGEQYLVFRAHAHQSHLHRLWGGRYHREHLPERASQEFGMALRVLEDVADRRHGSKPWIFEQQVAYAHLYAGKEHLPSAIDKLRKLVANPPSTILKADTLVHLAAALSYGNQVDDLATANKYAAHSQDLLRNESHPSTLALVFMTHSGIQLGEGRTGESDAYLQIALQTAEVHRLSIRGEEAAHMLKLPNGKRHVLRAIANYE